MMRVLIVDDEAPARDKLRRWLAEQADISLVGECADGLEAAASIAKLQPDAVFLDIQMPGMSGLEVAAQLEPAQAPLIVFVTAFDEHAIKAFDLNAVDYLLKPYDKDRLHKTLERLRERRGEAPAASAHGHSHRARADRLLRAPAGAAGRGAAAHRRELHPLARSRRQLRPCAHRAGALHAAAYVVRPAHAAW